MQDQEKIKTKFILTIIVITISIPLMGQLNLMPSENNFQLDCNPFIHVEKYPLLKVKANKTETNQTYISPSWIQPWKSEDLPVFCRAEHLIQKSSGMAFRFRLGSVDYVDALERK